jgi:hypothetical protein
MDTFAGRVFESLFASVLGGTVGAGLVSVVV